MTTESISYFRPLVAALAGITLLTLIVGCRSSTVDREQPVVEAAAMPAAPRAEQQTHSPAESITTTYFPSGKASSSLLALESRLPREIVRNKPFDYTLTVSNLSPAELEDVTVTETLPPEFELRGSTPEAQITGSAIVWRLGRMQANSSRSIQAELVGSSGGDFERCVKVSSATTMCQPLRITAPNLTLAKTMPEELLSCEDIPVTLMISNSGTGTIRGITLTEQLPDGLTTVDGMQMVRFAIPSLAANETISRSFMARATRPGIYESRTQAVSADGFSADANARILVRQPVLALQAQARPAQYQGRNIDYTFTIANTGDGPANGLLVTSVLPAGATFVKASDGGQSRNGAITWQLDSLAPGAERSLQLQLQADVIGRLANDVRATATCATAASASVVTEISGVAAMLLEVVDLSDPIEVGEQTTYEITVVNQGTATATKVEITCILEESQAYVTSEGATAGTRTENGVRFAPLAQLGAGETAIWRVTIRALEADDARFGIELKSDQLSRPVRENEATQQY